MNSNSTTPTSTVRSNGSEPKAAMTAVPVGVFIMFACLLYWGTLYLDQHAGGFSAKVYSPYASEKLLANAQPKSAGDELRTKGQKLFSANCAVCHQESGMGSAANGCPPLVGSEWVLGSPTKLVAIISKGLAGPIEVKGEKYGTGVMFAVGEALPGDEKEKAASIAAIATYIRSEWGNKAPAVKPEDAAKIRQGFMDRAENFTAEELQKLE